MMGGVQEKQVPVDCAQGGSLSRNSCRPLKRTRRFPLSPSRHSRARLSHIAGAPLRLDSRHRSDSEGSFVTASEALHFAPLRSGGQDRHRCIVLKQRREGSGKALPGRDRGIPPLQRTQGWGTQHSWNPTLAHRTRKSGAPHFPKRSGLSKADPALRWLGYVRVGMTKLDCSSLAACGPLPQSHFPGTAGWRQCRLRLLPHKQRHSAG